MTHRSGPWAHPPRKRKPRIALSDVVGGIALVALLIAPLTL